MRLFICLSRRLIIDGTRRRGGGEVESGLGEREDAKLQRLRSGSGERKDAKTQRFRAFRGEELILKYC